MSPLIHVLAIVLPLLAVAADSASAQDRGGCRGSGMSCAGLDYQCSLGDQTPYSLRRYCGREDAPYRRYREGAPYRRYDGPSYGEYRGRGMSYEELRYQCSLGDQTPVSLRRTCVQSGLW